MYYLAFGSWLSWILLLTVLALPWASLAVSLPAIRCFTLSTTGPEILQMGEPVQLWLLGSCEGPMPPFRGDIRLTGGFCPPPRKYAGDQPLIPAHCGSLTAAAEKGYVCDYLGLFAFRVSSRAGRLHPVRPAPVEIPGLVLPDPAAGQGSCPGSAGLWAEDHEIRLWQPGDSRVLVHWKLSAKTGQLLLREPRLPAGEQCLLTLTLKGTPDALDRKLGRLLWLGRKLAEENRCFQVRALTGDGILQFCADSEAALLQGMDRLLCARPAPSGSIRDFPFDAGWQYHIGGQPDEA